MGFVPGWNPESALRARARVQATVGFVTVRADAPIPPAWFIPCLRVMEQGGAGTCWDHAGTAVVEDFGLANGLDIVPTCRRLTGWVGKQFEGGGNPSNGGNVIDALLAMSDDTRGAGIAPEELLPYTDDYRSLGQRPPDSVFAAAKPFRARQPVDVQSDDDARRLIAANHPVGNGIWWAYSLDTEGETFFRDFGRGQYGHALEERGYALPGVFFPGDSGWFNFRNWHGQLYKPLPPELAAKVPNYRPDHPDSTSDFWISCDAYARLRAKGDAERVTITDLSGFGHLFHWQDMAP